MNRPILLLTAVLAVGSGQQEDCKTAPAGWPRNLPTQFSPNNATPFNIDAEANKYQEHTNNLLSRISDYILAFLVVDLLRINTGRPPQCCDLPFPLEGMKKQFGSCIRQIGSRQSSTVPTAQAVRDARLCIEECVYKGLGFMEEHNLNKDQILEQLKNGVADKKEWSKPMEDAVKTCHETITKRETPQEGVCVDSAHEFTHCVMRQLFLSCPASEWNSNEECNLVKSRMQACPNIPPPPPPPPKGFRGQGPPPQ